MQTWSGDVGRSGAVAAELRRFVVAAVGEPTRLEPLRVRPWAAVWRVEVGTDRFLAKQSRPGRGHEARLTVELARRVPSYVVPVTAADPERDLLLTPDLGPTLAAGVPERGVDVWCRVLRDAARLQRAVARDAETLDLTRLAPEEAVTYAGDAVGRLCALPAGDPRRLDPAVAGRLQALLPAVERWAEVVADLDLPLTLHHNAPGLDAVVLPTDPDAPVRFRDFGDALLTEPLGGLLVPLGECAVALAAGPDDLRLRRVADAALEVWSDLAPARSLRAALPAALQLARLARVESWRRRVATMTSEERREFGSAPARWLGSLVADPPVGATPADVTRRRRRGDTCWARGVWVPAPCPVGESGWR
ncbi:hypothetical protein [Nocardioides sp. TF02-7]|uniref:hypothetical protein n=1 Tax=Nocardioides sp. TF02-7 TaxID=2917724 RepID=UPI001F05549B|nr:hypothetical protein [Nocardioides sp. TF02-7]UMG92850.1 hypothetical protein MF408_00170 [Nocardioides sp. TF02-7]